VYRILLLVAVAAGCAGNPVDDPWHRTGPGRLPDTPDLRGTITARVGEMIRVEATPDEESGSAKAVVRLTPLTWITTARGEQLSLDALVVGQRVAVWFTGPVAESYPVQGEGLRIIVE
jgi:hypothetical protein